MLRAYFDESGTHAGALITALGGFTADEAKWRALDADWDAKLTQHGLAYFRMTECLSGWNQFLKWKKDPDRRAAIGDEFADIIIKHRPVPFWASVVTEDWERLTSPPFRNRYRTPYGLCFERCIHTVSTWAHAHAKGEPVALVFAEQDEYRDRASEVYGYYAGAQKYANLAGMAFAPARRCRPLQAADLLAHAMNKDMETVEYDSANFRKWAGNMATKLGSALGLHNGAGYSGVGLSNAVAELAVAEMDDRSRENFGRLRFARPGSTVDLLPYPESETAGYVLVGTCPDADRPHLHIRASNACCA
jgi:hypothetical protein